MRSLILLSMASASLTNWSTFASRLFGALLVVTSLHEVLASRHERLAPRHELLAFKAPRVEAFASKHEKLAPRHELLLFKVPPVIQEALHEDTSLIWQCCVSACRFRKGGAERKTCGGVIGGVIGMATGLGITLSVKVFADGGGVVLLVLAPLTTCAGAEDKLPKLRLEGAMAVRAAEA